MWIYKMQKTIRTKEQIKFWICDTLLCISEIFFCKESERSNFSQDFVHMIALYISIIKIGLTYFFQIVELGASFQGICIQLLNVLLQYILIKNIASRNELFFNLLWYVVVYWCIAFLVTTHSYVLSWYHWYFLHCNELYACCTKLYI